MVQISGGLIALAILGACASQPSSGSHGHHQSADQQGHQSTRQADVAKRGGPVMGFDLERTTHRFDPTSGGGVLTVVSDDQDSSQIALIQSHLRAQSSAFSRGDFSAPAAIHGANMAGLAELTKRAVSMRVSYYDLANGAEIRFSTADRALADALHRWFEAQRSDHGRHAVQH